MLLKGRCLPCAPPYQVRSQAEHLAYSKRSTMCVASDAIGSGTLSWYLGIGSGTLSWYLGIHMHTHTESILVICGGGYVL